MFLIIYGHQHGKYSCYLDQMFRLRHSIFIERRKWDLPSKNGFEIDQYDTDDAVYFISLDDDGSIEASVRLTPTIHSSLLADIFPHLVESGVSPRGPGIYEATRFIVQPKKSKTRSGMRRAKARLFANAFDWCLEHHVTHVQTVIDSVALGSFLETTPQTRVLGLAHPFGGGRGVVGGGECMAIRWPISQEVIDDVLAFADMDDRRFDSGDLRHAVMR